MLRRCKCLLWPLSLSLLLALYGTRSELNRVALFNKKKKLLRFIDGSSITSPVVKDTEKSRLDLVFSIEAIRFVLAWALSTQNTKY